MTSHWCVQAVGLSYAPICNTAALWVLEESSPLGVDRDCVHLVAPSASLGVLLVLGAVFCKTLGNEMLCVKILTKHRLECWSESRSVSSDLITFRAQCGFT